jgi:hypothetical protein
MTQNEKLIAELEADLLPELAAIRANRKAEKLAAEEAAKPKIGPFAVSEKMAEAVKANPESLRVSAKAADGDATLIERPGRKVVIPPPREYVVEGRAMVPSPGVTPPPRTEVLGVDGAGRPARVWEMDRAAQTEGVAEFEGGYRQPSGAVSNYDPIVRGLGAGEDE